MSVATRDGFVPRVRVKAEMTAAGLVQRIVPRAPHAITTEEAAVMCLRELQRREDREGGI
jgi:hypothetical protein